MLIFFIFVSSLSLYAQSSGGTNSAHYSIITESGAEGEEESLSRELELRFEAFNRLFRFNPAALTSPLKVRVFANRAAYDSYIVSKTGQVKSGAVYLHYSQEENRELVICRWSPEEASMLPHQAFVQFLRGFVANPPSWMREGFAIYFSGLKFDAASGKLNYEENLTWLDTVKKQKDYAPSLKSILEADFSQVPRVPPDFQIYSWALTSFLINSGKNSGSNDYFRTLAECFMILSPSASSRDNGIITAMRLESWLDPGIMEKDFRSYLDSRKTFNDFLEEGRAAYTSGDALNAELNFLSAQNQKPEHYAPWYYLGLLYYDAKNYSLADEYFRSSLSRGADEALVSYALGLNAAAAGKNVEAVQWLRRAASVSPERYRQRAEDLIKRLE